MRRSNLSKRLKSIFEVTNELTTTIQNSIVPEVTDESRNRRFIIEDGSSKYVVTKDLVCATNMPTSSTEEIEVLDKVIDTLEDLIQKG